MSALLDYSSQLWRDIISRGKEKCSMWGLLGALIGLKHKKKLLLSVVRFQIFLRENKAILFFLRWVRLVLLYFFGTILLPSFSRQ